MTNTLKAVLTEALFMGTEIVLFWVIKSHKAAVNDQ